MQKIASMLFVLASFAYANAQFAGGSLVQLKDFRDSPRLNRLSFDNDSKLMRIFFKAKDSDSESIFIPNQIGGPNFSIQFKWKSNYKLNTISNPNLEIGRGGHGGSYLSLDCNGARFVVSVENPKSWHVEDNSKNLELSTWSCSAKTIYFESNLNSQLDGWNKTGISFSNGKIEIWHNNFLAYSVSLEDALILNKTKIVVDKKNPDFKQFDTDNREGKYFSDIVEEISSAAKKGGFYLSFQKNSVYLHQDCLIQIADFEVVNRKVSFANVNSPKESDFEKKLHENKFLGSLMKEGEIGFPAGTLQMPVLKCFHPISDLKTPSVCTNGLVFYQSRKSLGVVDRAFYFHSEKGFDDVFDFPPIFVNHWFNNGNIYCFVYQAGVGKSETRFCRSFIKDFSKGVPGQPLVLKSEGNEFEAVAILENTVPQSVVDHLKSVLDKCK